MKVATCHLNTDFDALSSLTAASILFDAELFFPGSSEKSVTAYYKKNILGRYRSFRPRQNNQQIDTLIMVDFSDMNRVHRTVKNRLTKDTKIFIYDHHINSDNISQQATIHYKNYGSNTTQMAYEIKAKGIKITKYDATNLIIGIYVDTGSFKYQGTTPIDLEMAAWLLSCGADLGTIEKTLTRELEYDQVSILNQFLINEKVIHIGNSKIAVSYATSDEYISDISIVVSKFLIISDLTAAICTARLRSKVYIIIRSRNSSIVNARAAARLFGGGGHSYAASATSDMTLADVNLKLIKWVKKIKLKSFEAQQLMSTNLVTVSINSTISDTKDIMAKYAINSIPVIDDSKIVGILTRSLIERAIFHRLSSESVRKWMVTEFKSVAADAPFEIIRKIMIEGGQRFLPVVKRDRLIGAITRTDLLSVLYTMPGSDKTMEKNMSTVLRHRLDKKLIKKMEVLGKIAEQMGYSAYLVGGIVRDVIMGNQISDIDMVIIGDGIAFARKAADILNTKVSVHEQFMTAVLKTNGFKIDIATARNEYYNKPGALPTVAKGSLVRDLKRRDFTINSLAVTLSPNRFGILVDYFGGLADIKSKKIRVLHNMSFVEDPTRIFRAIRFAVRYKFQIGGQTERLMKNVVELDIMKDLKASRIMPELNLIFNEKHPSLTLSRLTEMGVWQAISANINSSEDAIARGESIVAAYNLIFRKKIDKTAFYLFLIGLFLDEKDLKITFIRIGAVNFIRKNLHIRKMRNSILKTLITCNKSEAYRKLSSLSIEAIMSLAAFTRSIKIRDKIMELIRHIFERPLLTGKDLIKLGFKEGRSIGKLLRKVEDMQIDGTINGYDEAISYSKQYLEDDSAKFERSQIDKSAFKEITKDD